MFGCKGLYPHVVEGAVLERYSTIFEKESTGEMVTVLRRDDQTGWVLVSTQGRLYPREVPIECLKVPRKRSVDDQQGE